MKIAVLGGSFNPLHIGHLALADAVHTELEYDRVVLVPTFISPFKQGAKVLAPEHRLNMVKLAVEDVAYITYSDYELMQKDVSYTVDSLAYFSEFFKTELTGKIGFIIGRDLADSFLKWRCADKILEMADIIVGNRLEIELPKAKTVCKDLDFPHIALDNVQLPISSTFIRQAILKKKSWRYLVPQCVYEYIVSNKLYEKFD